MKKIALVAIILAGIAFIAYKCVFSGKEDKQAELPRQQALTVSKNSGVFNESFDKVLDSYWELKKGLIEYDTVLANGAARKLGVAADSLKTNEIKGDSTGSVRELANNYAGTISGSAKGFVGEVDFIKKKKEFQMISDALYDLMRTVKYDRQKIYHQHCPMAFNDSEEAWWLSTSNQIENPYMGKKHPKYKGSMIECGDITDSLDFGKH